MKANISGSVSPIDGRYKNKVTELTSIFSEQALMRYRLIVEVEYLYHLSMYANNVVHHRMTKKELSLLRKLYEEFSDEDFKAIQAYEKITNHDVKAVEYFLREKLQGTSLESLSCFVHLGLTSEDINNLAYACMLREGTGILSSEYRKVSEMIWSFVHDHSNTPMLALTHGQPASPTTFGWEMKVFAERIRIYTSKLHQFSLSVKRNGATGGDNALVLAIPKLSSGMYPFSSNFIENLSKIITTGSMQFDLNMCTTQIEPHDTYAELFGILTILNTILIDFSRDMWMYISRGILAQQVIQGEVGSSAMPQKINPINFENAEGNFGIANALFNHFKEKLPVSRMQRDLSDSTVERNFGVAYAHTLIALKALQAGMKRVYVHKEKMHDELENAWEVVAEGYQVVLRVNGMEDSYEKLKDFTRGKSMTKEILHTFLDSLEGVSDEVIAILKNVTPHNYIGNRMV